MQAELGQAYRRTAIVTQVDAAVTYSSSDTKVATVDETGLVRTVSLGKAVITAKSGGAAASYNVNVVAAPATKTLEERINSLTLTPQPRPDWEKTLNWYDFSRVEKINNNTELSNYDKMKAVFNDIGEQTKGFSCTSHASLLGAAYEMLGFKVYGASGGVRTKDGKTPASNSGMMGFTKEGYTAHSWLAVEIDGVSKIASYKRTGTIDGKPFEYEVREIEGEDIAIGFDVELNGEILFFDLNLYSTHGMNFNQCFAIPPKNTSLYIAMGINKYY